MKDEKKLDYLEEERRKLWAKVIELEDKINKKPSDIEREAMQASRKASEYRNKADEARNNAVAYSEEALTKLESIRSTHSTLMDLYNKIESLDKNSQENNRLFIDAFDEIQKRKVSIEESISEIEIIYEDIDTYKDKIEKLDTIFKIGSETSTKLETLNKAVLNRKSEIDSLYYDIIGYEEKDDEGKTVRVPGKKR